MKLTNNVRTLGLIHDQLDFLSPAFVAFSPFHAFVSALWY